MPSTVNAADMSAAQPVRSRTVCGTDRSIKSRVRAGLLAGNTVGGGAFAQLVSKPSAANIGRARPRRRRSHRKKPLTADESKREWLMSANASNVFSVVDRAAALSYKRYYKEYKSWVAE